MANLEIIVFSLCLKILRLGHPQPFQTVSRQNLKALCNVALRHYIQSSDTLS